MSDQPRELLPCPFCGGPAGFIPDTSYGSCVVGCGDEECFGAARAFDVADFERASAAWNTRTEIVHNGRTAAEWYSLYCHEVAKCNRLQEELSSTVSLRELAEAFGIEVDGISGEDIDVLTGKRMHAE